ncbi:MAG: hypothetical protein H7Y88_01285 [Phycisphaerales bacterium]|nr:hypothetical protein [Phycisphaerales bacterium]
MKDERGRYTCRPCHDAVAATTKSTPPSPASDPIPLEEPEFVAADLLELIPKNIGLQQMPTCPGCEAVMLPGTVLCVQCGFDTRKGVKRDTGVTVEIEGESDSTRCPRCKYDMSGLKKPQCPECGAVVYRKRKTERERLKEESRTVARKAYLYPAITAAVGILGALMFFNAINRTDQLDWYFLNLAVQIQVGLAMYFVVCLIYMGFDAPFRMTAIRLASVYSVIQLLRAMVLAMQLPRIAYMGPHVIVGAIYLMLLCKMLDLDFEDAWLLALLTYMGMFAVSLAMFTWGR